MAFTKQNIPVLMYHALIDEKDPDIHFVHVLKDEFSNQIKWLYDNGYKTLSLKELYDCLVNGTKIPGKAVVLTFDDGYYSLYTYATPILQQYGFNAVLFLTTAAVGEATYASLPHCAAYPPDDRPLTWGELKEMEAKGWEIHAHGHRHYNHTLHKGKALEEEISLSRQAIWDHLQFKTEFYCYPYGKYNAETLAKISELGFKAAFGIEQGFANGKNDLGRVCRIGIFVFDDIEIFRQKVRIAYGSRKEAVKFKIKAVVSRSESLLKIVRWCKQLMAK